MRKYFNYFKCLQLYDFNTSSSQSYYLPSNSQKYDLPQENILRENEIASSILAVNIMYKL